MKRDPARRWQAKVPSSCPIWTAFITHHVTSPTWLRWSKNSYTVYLAQLQRHVFSSEYVPHMAANGEHFLDFELLTGNDIETPPAYP